MRVRLIQLLDEVDQQFCKDPEPRLHVREDSSNQNGADDSDQYAYHNLLYEILLTSWN
jgi:hypothetical protein